MVFIYKNKILDLHKLHFKRNNTRANILKDEDRNVILYNKHEIIKNDLKLTYCTVYFSYPQIKKLKINRIYQQKTT